MNYRIISPQVLTNFLSELGIYDYKVNEYLKFDGLTSIEIKRGEKKRTNPQNNLWHEWVTAISNHTGQTMVEVKNECKWDAWQTDAIVKIKFNGEDAITIKSSRDASTKQMGQLLDATDIKARKLDIRLRYPEHFGY